MDMITSCHKGERIIIAGCSPHILKLPKALLETGPVIALNEFPAWSKRYDYWLTCDSQILPVESPDFYAALNCPKFLFDRPDERKPPEGEFYWFERPDPPWHQNYTIPTVWEGKLQWTRTSATAAINLAIIMGASEVVLYGVDFVGNTRYDGHVYRWTNPPYHTIDDWWGPHVADVNAFLRKAGKFTKIYKLHPESRLDADLLSY